MLTGRARRAAFRSNDSQVGNGQAVALHYVDFPDGGWAALNLAVRDQLCASDAAWKHVSRFSAVAKKKRGYLSSDERAALLDACPPDLEMFARGLLLTAARPGELAQVTASNFDHATGKLKIPGGKTGARDVVLSSAASALFAKLTKDKIGGAGFHP